EDQGRGLAGLEIAVPGLFALVGHGEPLAPLSQRAQRGPAAVADGAVEPALRRLQRRVDTRHLLLEQGVAALAFPRPEPLVVGGLERLEGGHDLMHGGARGGIRRRVFGFFHLGSSPLENPPSPSWGGTGRRQPARVGYGVGGPPPGRFATTLPMKGREKT